MIVFDFVGSKVNISIMEKLFFYDDEKQTSFAY